MGYIPDPLDANDGMLQRFSTSEKSFGLFAFATNQLFVAYPKSPSLVDLPGRCDMSSEVNHVVHPLFPVSG